MVNVTWMSTLLVLLVWLLGVAMGAQEAVKENQIDPTDPETQRILKEALLKSWGLNEIPNVDRSRVRVPPYMLQLYNLITMDNIQQTKEETTNMLSEIDPDLLANTIRSFTHQEKTEDLKSKHTMVLQFNVSGIPEKETIRAVQLRISHEGHTVGSSGDYNITQHYKKTKKWTKKDVDFLQRLRVFDIIRPSRDVNHAVHRLLDTSVVDSRTSGTVTFDVAPAVQRWLKRPRSNHGLFLEVTPLKAELIASSRHKHSFRFRRDVGQQENDWAQQEPLLLVHSDDGNAKPRRKRESKPYKNKSKEYCQRHNLRVDFKRVGWTTWILAPAGYDAFFCHGECGFPLSDNMNATNHAVVQTLLHSKYPSRVPAACCVPTVHTAMSMLYVVEDESVVLKNYQDMIVEACGCR